LSFFVPTVLIEQQSDVLGALVAGKLREAIEKKAFLEDTDENTFARFLQFSLMSDYTPAKPLLLVTTSDDPSAGWSDSFDPNKMRGPKKKKKKKKPVAESATEKIEDEPEVDSNRNQSRSHEYNSPTEETPPRTVNWQTATSIYASAYTSAYISAYTFAYTVAT
jgi:hypothetical protein